MPEIEWSDDGLGGYRATVRGSILTQRPIGRTGHWAGFIDGKLAVDGGGMESNRRRLAARATPPERQGRERVTARETPAEVAAQLLAETPDLTAAERKHLEEVVAGGCGILFFRSEFIRTRPSPVTAEELYRVFDEDPGLTDEGFVGAIAADRGSGQRDTVDGAVKARRLDQTSARGCRCLREPARFIATPKRSKVRTYRLSGRIVSLSDGPTRLRIEAARGIRTTTDFMGVGPFEGNICVTGAIRSIRFVPPCVVADLKIERLE
jgi:hypothetical protein